MLLQTLNGMLKSQYFPQRWRHTLVKFYLLNIEHERGIFDAHITSEDYRVMLDVWKIIMRDQGYADSLIRKECVDSDGRPIPWITYPAIEYLNKLDFSQKTVFEYGAGNSTLWWSQRAKTITSVEGVEAWYESIRNQLPNNCRILYEPDHDRQIAAVGYDHGAYDVIVVDGLTQSRGRLRCCMAALKHLRPGGMIILDNSDYLPMSTQFLRDAGLIEVDMSGLTPLLNCSATTSLFFMRDFNIQPKAAVHPGAPLGGVTQNWEDENHPNQRQQ